MRIAFRHLDRAATGCPRPCFPPPCHQTSPARGAGSTNPTDNSHQASSRSPSALHAASIGSAIPVRPASPPLRPPPTSLATDHAIQGRLSCCTSRSSPYIEAHAPDCRSPPQYAPSLSVKLDEPISPTHRGCRSSCTSPPMPLQTSIIGTRLPVRLCRPGPSLPPAVRLDFSDHPLDAAQRSHRHHLTRPSAEPACAHRNAITRHHACLTTPSTPPTEATETTFPCHLATLYEHRTTSYRHTVLLSYSEASCAQSEYS